MKIHFIKTNPSGNTTLLVTTAVSPELYVPIASILMRPEWGHAEQVGFIVPNTLPNTPELIMMGGEFCGNATRSLAAYAVHLQLQGEKMPSDGQSLLISCSGASQPITCKVTQAATDPSNRYEVSACLPAPVVVANTELQITPASLQNSIADVSASLSAMLSAAKIFDCGGLMHIVIPTECSDYDILAEYFTHIKPYALRLPAPAVGVLFYNEKQQTLIPIVHVKKTNTTYCEQSCGSGTIAVGAYINEMDHAKMGATSTPTAKRLDLQQPGGVLTVLSAISPTGQTCYHLSGSIDITLEGTAFITL